MTLLDIELHVSASHVIAVSLAVAGPLAASLVAWGRLNANVNLMKERQKDLVSASDLRAAVAEMTTSIYKALGDRRDPDEKHDRRQS